MKISIVIKIVFTILIIASVLISSRKSLIFLEWIQPVLRSTGSSNRKFAQGL